MESSFDFNDLFVLDLANNHQGDVEHGLSIIRQHGAVLKARHVRGAIKFQFRQSGSFMHPTHKVGSTNKLARDLFAKAGSNASRRLLDHVKVCALNSVHNAST